MLLTGLLLLACSVCFLTEPKTTSPEMAPPIIGWALPPQSLIEKMPYSWISWRTFLKGGSFLCDNSSLCRVDTQNLSGHLSSGAHGLSMVSVTEANACDKFAYEEGGWDTAQL